MGPGPQAGSEPSAAAPGGRRASGGLGESVWARAQSSPRFALQASGRRSPESGSKPEKIDPRSQQAPWLHGRLQHWKSFFSGVFSFSPHPPPLPQPLPSFLSLQGSLKPSSRLCFLKTIHDPHLTEV